MSDSDSGALRKPFGCELRSGESQGRRALERCPADLVVSNIGVTGPGPDEDGNLAGLVYLATASRTEDSTCFILQAYEQ
jgi:nicotinamide mononucleotide (NMN) deamidase PncC